MSYEDDERRLEAITQNDIRTRMREIARDRMGVILAEVAAAQGDVLGTICAESTSEEFGNALVRAVCNELRTQAVDELEMEALNDED